MLLAVLRTPPQALHTFLRKPSETTGQIDLKHDLGTRRIPEEKLREIDMVGETFYLAYAFDNLDLYHRSFASC